MLHLNIKQIIEFELLLKIFIFSLTFLDVSVKSPGEKTIEVP